MKLHRFFRLTALRDDLERRLLVHEYRSLLTDDPSGDSGLSDVRERLFEVSSELTYARSRCRW
ncbi:hypothetical protein [Agrobacterium tumefaciens]|uniref:hypothetical protein n=1 Tax=Agrobacterium tumefaciens TaxID=358 RepID=UPI00287BD1DA|nr:hypothetical protein [Agrobacterium tumefaciens]MDS7594219.1 hypothetical protein [Agrobacterium tumefaciens]